MDVVKKLLAVTSLDINKRMKDDWKTALHGEFLFLESPLGIRSNSSLGAVLANSPNVVALLLINGANDQLRDNKFALPQAAAVG